MSRAKLIPALLVAGLYAAPPAHAAAVTCTETTPQGTVLLSESCAATSGFDTSAPISIPSAGELDVSLGDEGSLPGSAVPSFAALQFGINSLSGALVPLGAAGVETLDLTAPQQVYIEVVGAPQSSSYGIYNLNATFVAASSAVSLPPGAPLLILGTGALWISARRRGSPAHAISTSAIG
jgi:hypothetical protein